MKNSSFRDPGGNLIYFKNNLYRIIKKNYQENYDHMMRNLYGELTVKNLLIPHQETNIPGLKLIDKYKIIKPVAVKFISYPYEWCFSQLKDAALTTLKIQKIALRHNMTLKDASAYNIQFRSGKPILIDTLSFKIYQKGQPWTAYRQFCEHFLAPLALMSYIDSRANLLSISHLDGIPLSLARALLPFKINFKPSLLTHITLHSLFQNKFGNTNPRKFRRIKINKTGIEGIVDNLEKAISELKIKKEKTIWTDYYHISNYSAESFIEKQNIVTECIGKLKPRSLWDIASNNGMFSFIAAGKNIPVVAMDYDYSVIEELYRKCINENCSLILPLRIDLSNPSPALGWNNLERKSLIERGPADTALVLSIIHHLAITNNIPLSHIASFFAKICNSLIIEFIPRNDSQTQKLLSSKPNSFEKYNRENFEAEFLKYFKITKNFKLTGSSRIIYLMIKK